jgi:HD-GYP domain-containing protein (c-di-GMP phosphodiesterase class II)
LDDEAAQAVLDHKEYWDGSGFPQGLKGEEISLWGRILAVADLASSSVLARPYRDAVLELEEVRRSLLAASGTRLDPDLVKAYLKILDGE